MRFNRIFILEIIISALVDKVRTFKKVSFFKIKPFAENLKRDTKNQDIA